MAQTLEGCAAFDRDLFASLAPDERALLGWVAPQLDAAAIEEIATADYGVDVPEYRRALTELVHSPWLPDDLIGNPGAVLALTRSTTPASRRGHLQRLFACTLLVEELDAVLTDPELPWRRRPRSPLFARRDTGSGGTRRLWSALVTRCLVDSPAVVDPRLAALGRALSGDTATQIGELRALFTATT